MGILFDIKNYLKTDSVIPTKKIFYLNCSTNYKYKYKYEYMATLRFDHYLKSVEV